MKKNLVLLLSFLNFSSLSYADQFIGSYQVACDPSVGYFSFRTIVNNDMFSNVSSTLPSVDNLIGNPYRCHLPKLEIAKGKDREIVVEASYSSPPDEEGTYAPKTIVVLWVKENDIEKVRFGSCQGGAGPCVDRETHLIEITPYDARHCTIPASNLNVSASAICNKI